ncbi:MAG: dUTP diphosphatase [Desulfovibrionaceae bacterium]
MLPCSVNVLYMNDAARELYAGQGGLCYATPQSAGLDLRACFAQEVADIAPGQRLGVPTGLAMAPCQPGVAGFVYARSGLGAVQGLTVAQGVGLIDPDYRGEIRVFLLNTSDSIKHLRRGERMAQIVFQPYFRAELTVVDALESTERGAGGFGHSGR